MNSLPTPFYKDELITVYNQNSLDVMKEMEPESIDFCLTDPPYLVNFQSNRRIVKHKKIVGDNSSDWLRPALQGIYNVLRPESLLMSFYGWPELDEWSVAFYEAGEYVNEMKVAGFEPKSHFCFIKSNIGLGWFSRTKHEQGILMAKGSPPKPAHAIADVIHGQMTGNEYHPTQKPLEWLYPIIECFTKPGDIVLDPFGGSLTTAVACKRLGRRCIIIELDEEYCRRGVERLTQSELFR